MYEGPAGAGGRDEVKAVVELAGEVGGVVAPDRAAAMAHAAWEVSSSGAEVTDRALAVLSRYLPAPPTEEAP